jgi:hypothetical protein
MTYIISAHDGFMEKHSPGRHLSKILESQLNLLYLGWNIVESGVKQCNLLKTQGNLPQA